MATKSESAAKPKRNMYYVHVLIGLAIIAIFWVIPPWDPITPVGMRCLGTFLGMIYLWSFIESLWPSILGLFLFGISGYGGGTVNAVWLNAIGNYTVLLTLLAMTLFGAMSEVGDTHYIAKWFLTRPIFKGRPWVFMVVFYLCCIVLSALVSPITSLIILWPIALGLMEVLDVTRKDTVWKWFFVGMFLVSTLIQPFFPFFGAQLIPISAFASMTQAMGHPMNIPMVPYMVIDGGMTLLIMFLYLGIMKIMRVDVSKFQHIDPVMIEKQLPLPPMNFQQKAYLWMLPIYLLLMLVPSFFPNNPICQFLSGTLGPLGITAFFVVLFLVIRWNGKPLLDFQYVAYKQMNWGIFFMIAAAVYGANSLAADETGVVPWLVQILNPILGGQPEMVFVALMFTVALIITNFANNAAMAVVLLPVALTFSNQIGINPIPVAMGIILMVFVAMLTPSASPHASMMHGRKDIYSTKEILQIGLPMCAITLLLYIFVAYPLMKLMLGV